jgi:hypothetical protein
MRLLVLEFFVKGSLTPIGAEHREHFFANRKELILLSTPYLGLGMIWQYYS